MSHLVHTQLFKHKVFNINDTAFAALNVEADKQAVIVTSAKISDEQATMLNNILKACKISKNDVQVIEIQSSERIRLQDVLNATATNFIFFGLPPKSIAGNFNYKLYNAMQVKNKQLVFSNSFARLDKEVELKKFLWNALKVMFNID